ITAQLIDVADGYHFWSQRYDRELDDIFTVQEEIALAIVDKLRIQLLGKEKERLMRRHTDDVAAHSIYLEGRYFWNQRKADSLQKAIACFRRAIDRDPNYALPYVGLADSFSILGTYGFLMPNEAFAQARAAAQRALELCGELGEAHATLGWIYTIHDFKWSAGETALSRAIELSPSYASAHCWLAMSLLGQGRRDEALKAARRSRELDPLSLAINANLGLVLTFAGLVDEAILQYRRTLELERRFPLAHLWLGAAYLVKGDYDAATAAFTDGMQVGGHNPFALGHLVIALSASGKTAQAGEPLRRVESPPPQGYHSSYCRAVARFGVNDDDAAYALLDQAYEERDPMLIFVQSLRRFPCLADRVEKDARYARFLKRIDLKL
ncbi:MAG: tetratricopeptide repeat protein, partial [Chitinivibrionales bacterium]|nr:tetratricopeptide repeat protein [Chitinivibrionales bacterium]